MKRKFISLVIFLMTSFYQINGQTPSEAIEYMNDMYQFYDQLKVEQWQYLKAVTRSKGNRKIDNRREDLINEIKQAKSIVSQKKAFYADISLKTAMVNYLDLSYTVMNEDFSKILDMEEIAEQSYDLMEAYLLAKEKANEKVGESYKIVQDAQAAFAEKYNVNLIEAEGDKLSDRISKASDVLGYYNDVYLVFFKAYKQEAYVLDALGKGDINAMEQNISTLESDAASGVVKLKEIGDYKTDRSFRMGTIEMLHFYTRESRDYFSIMVDFFLKKDNFEKLQKAMDSKKKKDRTQEDIDNYNISVKEYNTAVADYNAAIKASNEQRSKALEAWNKRSEKFLEEHSK